MQGPRITTQTFQLQFSTLLSALGTKVHLCRGTASTYISASCFYIFQCDIPTLNAKYFACQVHDFWIPVPSYKTRVECRALFRWRPTRCVKRLLSLCKSRQWFPDSVNLHRSPTRINPVNSILHLSFHTNEPGEEFPRSTTTKSLKVMINLPCFMQMNFTREHNQVLPSVSRVLFRSRETCTEVRRGRSKEWSALGFVLPESLLEMHLTASVSAHSQNIIRNPSSHTRQE